MFVIVLKIPYSIEMSNNYFEYPYRVSELARPTKRLVRIVCELAKNGAITVPKQPMPYWFY